MNQQQIMFLDAKKLTSQEAYWQYNREVKPNQNILRSYLLPRYSSKQKIVSNTLIASIAGTLFGLSQSIYKDIPKSKLIPIFIIGSFGMGLSYFTINEIFNGAVVRSLKREYYIINNSLAAFFTAGLFLSVQVGLRRRDLQISLIQSIKYSMTLCVASMLSEIYIISMRNKYLQRTKNVIRVANKDDKRYDRSLANIVSTIDDKIKQIKNN